MLRIRMATFIPGKNGQKGTREMLYVNLFAEAAEEMMRNIDEAGHNYAMVTGEVRCVPFKKADGSTNKFMSLDARTFVSSMKGKYAVIRGDGAAESGENYGATNRHQAYGGDNQGYAASAPTQDEIPYGNDNPF